MANNSNVDDNFGSHFGMKPRKIKLNTQVNTFQECTKKVVKNRIYGFEMIFARCMIQYSLVFSKFDSWGNPCATNNHNHNDLFSFPNITTYF